MICDDLGPTSKQGELLRSVSRPQSGLEDSCSCASAWLDGPQPQVSCRHLLASKVMAHPCPLCHMLAREAYVCLCVDWEYHTPSVSRCRPITFPGNKR